MAGITFTERVQKDGLWYRHNVYADGTESWELDEPAAPDPPTLQISLSATQVPVNTPVTATVTVQDSAGTVQPVTGAYWVPVIRQSDKWQAEFLRCDLINGQATVSFSLPQPGVYTIDPEHIRPRPTAELPAPVELIVTP